MRTTERVDAAKQEGLEDPTAIYCFCPIQILVIY